MILHSEEPYFSEEQKNKTSDKVSEIVTEYRRMLAAEHPATYQRDGQMSLRKFAARLSSEAAPMSISQQAIAFWSDGTSVPSLNFILVLSQMAKEQWARDFAADVLAALRPELYKPAGEIGRRILGNGQPPALPQETAE
jgi:hypothetical protein